MAEVQTSEVDEKPATVCPGPPKVKFGNHGNQTFCCVTLEVLFVFSRFPSFVNLSFQFVRRMLSDK
jgi:hypothetical protein